MTTRNEKLEAFGRLLDIMDMLRSNCNWNASQTFDSLRSMTIEECYELSDAVLRKDNDDIKKELGDLFLHIVFYSKIASEEGIFDVTDVLNAICEKMIFRHPHIFDKKSNLSSEDVAKNWEMIKMKEKGGNHRVLSGVPISLPSIIKAYAMQDKARGVGFDWEEKQQVWDKVEEEREEVMCEINILNSITDELDKENQKKKLEAEFGDLLFSVINAARLYDINPDTALNRTCEKFRNRFTYLEEHTIRKGMSLKDMSLSEMDEIWNESKKYYK